ncbi:carbohydrate porin [Rhizobium tubonense]|uniref:Carbohydrate porin n=2 Tax=Rhizobium tubonense TaxID=484088 RepID=A0A2W4C376_9HYPH|nr:carbohydrate porin [Rhizobium tubonense]
MVAVVLFGTGAKAGGDLPPNYAQTTLTGDWDGYRSWLVSQGATFTITQTIDVLGNVSGGVRTGAAYDGVFELQGDFDMARLVGWTGGEIHISGYAIQGRGLSERDLSNLLTVTSAEADSGVRLGEFYLSQSLLNDKVTLKLGQILADQSFAISNTAGLFVNSTFGWPGLFGTDLPGGGPAYPFAVPGVQIIVNPGDAWTLQAAILNGSPTGSTSNGNANGLGFPIGNGILAIAEAAYAYTPPADGNGLRGTYKLGAWYNSEQFDSLSTASNGVSLASPVSSGHPRSLSGDFALYAIADQELWREHGNSDNGLNGFARAAIAPRQDRNIVNWYLDMGLTYKGPLPGRDSDTIGVGFAYANIGGAVSELAKATNAFMDRSQPIPSSEAVVEVTYQAAITQALSIQPFFQYVIHPGGNATDPKKPGSSIPNAAVLGVRTSATF